MTDPARLLNTRLDAASLRALEAAIGDEPPDNAKAQIWQSIAVALPVTGVLLGATTTTSIAGAGSNLASTGIGGASVVGTVGAGAAVAKTGLGVLAGKAVALGLGIGLAAHVATGVVTRDPAPRATVTVAVSSEMAPTPVARVNRLGGALRAPFTGGEPAELDVAGLSSTGAEPVIRTVTSPPNITTNATHLRAAPIDPLPNPAQHESARDPVEANGDASTSDAVADEVVSDELRQESSLLVRARQALAVGQPAVAMAYVGQHRERFFNGKLQQEREAIEVQCLAKLGRRAEAKLRARTFLAAHPTSPHREQIRAIAGE